MRIVTFAERDTPAALRRQALALQEEAWPTDEGATHEGKGAEHGEDDGHREDDGPGEDDDAGQWHDPALAPIAMLLVDDTGIVVAALDILTKEITHAGQRFLARGLSRVVTGSRHRGRGHGRRLVAAARDTIERSGADLGIFTCDSELRGFYESAGWPHLPGAVLIGGTPEDPFPSDRFDKVTMAAFFTGRACAQAHTFPGTRVALYPGVIDRLW
ncbi:N-acetyltransferase [Catellatospora sp. IY07-71]|uniref:GNAT family N-acetyltransferase n=1 Tax=Catellatospora sp. IY07-71 TaxID=2728827 RepID=UPI001BB4373E|nr:GNAT family N-acetyltransferase [Catellatospora sp. IY07-71]BCJ72042.1 N-acetyltransferase [Catellatospora sp. IY07-71]